MLSEIFLYGIGAVFFAGLAVMAHGYITAPDGYEDERGFITAGRATPTQYAAGSAFGRGTIPTTVGGRIA